MWTREELKTNAKLALKRYYWVAVATCLIHGILSQMIVQLDNGIYVADMVSSIISSGASPVAARNPMGVLWYVGIAFSIFVGSPLLVGLTRYFMESRTQTCSIGVLFYAFKGGRYLKVVKVMFITGLKVLLWTLLFIVPGIIKSYEYYFVPYILAENTNLEVKQYFSISKAMSDNDKANIFVLDLSFFGWIFLGVLLCGAGLIFITPYFQATYAELYAFMRQKVFASNKATQAELPDFLIQ